MCACSSRTCVHISGKRGVLTPRAALSHLLARVILVVQRWTASSLDERCPAGPRPTPRVLGATARHPGSGRVHLVDDCGGRGCLPDQPPLPVGAEPAAGAVPATPRRGDFVGHPPRRRVSPR